MSSKTAILASACVLNFRRSSSAHSSVAKKDSASALSQASPTLPIDGFTPASRHRRPKATEVSWQPWSEWWMTPFGRSPWPSNPAAPGVEDDGQVEPLTGSEPGERPERR
jgi:hypothetical protein